MIKRDFLRHFKGSFIQWPRDELGKVMLFPWHGAQKSATENQLPRSVHLNSAKLVEHQLHDMHFARYEVLKEEENAASETLGDFSKFTIYLGK